MTGRRDPYKRDDNARRIKKQRIGYILKLVKSLQEGRNFELLDLGRGEPQMLDDIQKKVEVLYQPYKDVIISGEK